MTYACTYKHARLCMRQIMNKLQRHNTSTLSTSKPKQSRHDIKTLHINATHHLVDLLIAEDGPGELGALGGLHALGDGEDDVVGLADDSQLSEGSPWRSFFYPFALRLAGLVAGRHGDG